EDALRLDRPLHFKCGLVEARRIYRFWRWLDKRDCSRYQLVAFLAGRPGFLRAGLFTADFLAAGFLADAVVAPACLATGLLAVLFTADLFALAFLGRSEEHTSELQSRENIVC